MPGRFTPQALLCQSPIKRDSLTRDIISDSSFPTFLIITCCVLLSLGLVPLKILNNFLSSLIFSFTILGYY